MNCPKAKRLFILYLHGKDGYVAYRAHRQACAVCQQELGYMNALAEKQRLRTALKMVEWVGEFISAPGVTEMKKADIDFIVPANLR